MTARLELALQTGSVVCSAARHQSHSRIWSKGCRDGLSGQNQRGAAAGTDWEGRDEVGSRRTGVGTAGAEQRD